MEPDYKWIAQDKNGVITKFVDCPVIIGNHWRKGIYGEYKRITVGKPKPNPNWRDSLIDLEKEDFEIVDGILVRKPRAEVSRSGLTDTELLDAIVEHKLRIGRLENGNIFVGSDDGIDATNKKGNIRKAIKKWLRKNVDTKPVEDDVTYHVTENRNGELHTQFCPTLESLKKYVESL